MKRIQTGVWQTVVGLILLFFGLFAMLAGDLAIGSVLISAGGPFFFWGTMLRNLRVLDDKLEALAPLLYKKSD